MPDVDPERPRRCPDCGSREIRERRETGGGWRRVLRCADCGARIPEDDD